MIILVPFFGDVKRFRPVLDRWVAAYRASGCKAPWFVLTDDGDFTEWPSVYVSTDGWRDIIRPGQRFDVKGALVCGAALRLTEPLLVVDADALFLQDPVPALVPFCEVPIALPLDHGAAVAMRVPRLEFPFDDVRKSCAGVIWFGQAWARSRIVGLYRRSFAQMKDSLPWSPPLPHLLEQYSWSVASQRVCRKFLPPSLNWSVRHLGANPGAVIDHDYGRAKWS